MHRAASDGIRWRKEGMLQMKTVLETADYTMQEEQRQWASGDISVMTADIAVPRFGREDADRVSRRLNRYYCQCVGAFLSYCSHTLYPQALAEYSRADPASAAPPRARASLRCTVTCNQDRILSLYTDCTEWAGTSRSLTLRRADTWNLAEGMPVTAHDCFPGGTKIRRLCLSAAQDHCARQHAAGLSVYAGDLSLRLRRHLNLRNFYLSPEGFHFFYQPYAIAPASEGCPTFLLPFSADPGPIWPAAVL